MDFGPLFRHDDARQHKAGDVIFHEGDAALCMYVVRSGEVEIRVRGIGVERVGPGNLAGEMAMIDPAPRSASLVALTDCELVAVDQKRFLFLIQQTPYFAINVMTLLARRIRAANARAP